jgi:hypothetical protein
VIRANTMAWTARPVDASSGHGALVFKEGGTAGFSSVIVLNQAKDLAVLVASAGADPACVTPSCSLAIQLRVRRQTQPELRELVS